MVPQEKEALLALGSSLAFGVFAFPLQALFPGARCEALFLAILGFVAVLWTGRRVVGLRSQALDERDIAVRYQAGLVGSHVFGTVVMIGAVALWALHRTTLTVPSVEVVLLASCRWLATYLVWEVIILALYRRGS